MNIYEIAKIVGYSPSVVARALSGKGYCSEEKKRKVIDIATEMGYRPSIAAKTMRNNFTYRVLMCIPDLYNSFYFRMIDGVSRGLAKYNYYTMLFHTQSSTDKEVDAVELLEQKYCDGIVMVSFDFCEKNISAVVASNKPVVLTNYYDKILPNSNYDCVYVDHTEALRMLTQHIITVGGRNILYIGGDVKTQTAKERRKGYEKALQENNRDIDTRLMADGKFTQEGGYIQAKKALESGLEIDSIITANDLMCIGVLKYLYEKDIVVGKDIMLASVDNSDFVQNTHPTITAIDLCQDEIGLKASSLLMDRILNKRTTSKVVKILPKLIIRNSTSKAQDQ